MQFHIESREGLPIRGDLESAAEPRALVVIVHGFKGFKDWGFFPWVAETLCGAGLAVCRFNMSRSGIGTNPDSFDRLDLFADDTYSTQVDDLLAVVAHAQTALHLPTFLFGHSRGGGVALLAASRVPNLAGVMTWSAIARADRWDAATKAQWRRNGHLDVVNSRTNQVMPMSTRILDDYEKHRDRLDILRAVSHLRVPLLVAHGRHDESVPFAESEEIAARSSDATHLVIENASHTYNAIHPLVNVPEELALVTAVTTRFAVVYG